ncbi:hypothetical protein Pfo_020008 [Paulownia fortunei]|nr:hypothetical protein Pfo_020008 [Paulownia fortunei]
MPKLQIQKSFTNASQKIKISNKRIQSALSSCKHPKTTSSAAYGKEKGNDADEFLFENFRSLYRKDCEEVTAKNGRTASFLFDEPEAPKNLAEPQRFSGGGSSTEAEAEEIGENDSPAQDDFITILTYSPSPYEDFRRSMQEMVKARSEHNGKVDWEFMEELLFCYLDLNNEKSYRYILRAFVDSVVILRENSWRIPARGRPRNGGGGRRQPRGET